MKKNLSYIKKKELRKRAYSLKPFVIIGQHGLTDSVLAEINVALNAHELIKIRIREADKNVRSQQCLKIVILYFFFENQYCLTLKFFLLLIRYYYEKKSF